MNDNRYSELLVALSREIEIPSKNFVVVIGALDIKLNIFQAIMKANVQKLLTTASIGDILSLAKH